MKARVTVMLKAGVLDVQGEAVRHALATLGFGGVNGVRQGKLIELDLAETDRDAAELAVKGSSDTSGLELSYPLVRSRLQNLYVNLGVDNKKFKNFSGGRWLTSAIIAQQRFIGGINSCFQIFCAVEFLS